MKYGVNATSDLSPLARSYTWWRTNDIRQAENILKYAQRAWPEFHWTIGVPSKSPVLKRADR